MSSESKAAACIIAGMALAAFCIAMAVQFGMILLYIIIPFAAVFIIKWGIIPIVKQGLEVADKTTDIIIKIREARQPYFQVAADPNGNYSQILDRRTGEVITLLTPGNAPVAQIAGPGSRYYIDEAIDADLIEEPLQIAAPGGIDPETVTAPSFREELNAGLMEPGSPYIFGYRIVIDEFTKVASLEAITDAHKATVFLLGASTVGKSSLVAGLLARRARVQNNVAFLIFDPHKGNPDRSITARILPALDSWIIQPKNGVKITGKKPAEVRAAVDFLLEQKELRLERDDLTEDEKAAISPYYDLDIVVVIDECLSYARETRIAGHDSAFDELVALMQSMATETAKAGITGVFMSQLGTKEQLGAMEIRDACPVQVVLRTPRDQGKALGMTGEEAKLADRFPKGRGFYKTYEGYERFVWSFATDNDITAALAGVTSPLQPARNRIINLVSKSQQNNDFYAAETWAKEDGNEIETRYPAALQASLEQIPEWKAKLAVFHNLVGSDRRDIWQAIFKHAPGGANNAKDAAEYKTLLEAYRYDIQQLKEANGG